MDKEFAYLLIEAYYDDIRIICCSFDIDLLNEKLSNLKQEFKQKHNFDDSYAIIKIPFVER